MAARWKCLTLGVALPASILGSGCGGACEVDGECDPVECRSVEVQACLDRSRANSSAVWPLGQGHPGSCATEDDCDELEALFSQTGTGTGFDTRTSTGTDTGAGGSP